MILPRLFSWRVCAAKADIDLRVKYGQVEGIPILSDVLQLYISVDTVTVSAPPYSLGAGLVGYGL